MIELIAGFFQGLVELIGGALAGFTLTLVLLSLRSLLRKTASMRTELDAVI